MPIFSLSGNRPTDLGVQSGRLKTCPSSPNCVCSYDTDKEHGIEPIQFSGESKEAIASLKQIIETTPLTEIIESSDDYLYAEFTTKLMGYVDDVEFYAPANTDVIHVRSASRLGKSDLGLNRKRVEEIRAKFKDQSNS